jgi:salicylate hydroxylase
MLPRKVSSSNPTVRILIPKDQGQGGCQAIEDALALGISLMDCTPEVLDRRIQLYEKIRMNRASVITIFSNAGQDEPEKMYAEVRKFIPADSIPSKLPRPYILDVRH